MKVKIIEERGMNFSAEYWDGKKWLFLPGTCSNSAEEAEFKVPLSLANLNSFPRTVKEFEVES